MTFDTFTYAEGLKNSGIPDEHVRALTQELTKALESEDLATKQDIAAVRQEIKDLAVTTKQDIAELAAATKQDIAELKTDISRWVIGMMVAQTGIIIAAIKLL